MDKVLSENIETAIFAGGCFWGVEYYMKQLPGIISIEAGYIGGHKASPSYKEVKERRSRKTTGIIGKMVVFTLLLIYAVCLMLPFYVLFVTSIAPYQELMGSMSFIWWPEEVTWDAFIPFISTDNILADDIGIPILHGFFNTLWSTLLTTIVSLFVSGLAAYSYSKIRFRGKEALFMFQLATMMIPMATMTVPSLIW